jgi:hypothetical protein
MLEDVFSFLVIAVILASVIAFLYILFNKWGLWEFLQVNADDWLERTFKIKTDLLNRLFSCPFCTIWWISVIVCLFLAFSFWEPGYLAMPFVSTVISRKLL